MASIEPFSHHRNRPEASKQVDVGAWVKLFKKAVPLFCRSKPCARTKRSAVNWVGFLTGAFALGTASVQAQALDLSEVHQAANDWSQNWAESWRARIKGRHSRFERLFNWQLSENTLLSFYGQLNPMYLNYEDGVETILSVRDNVNSPGRLGLRVETDLNSGIGIFANLESGLRRTDYDSVFGIGPPEATTDWNRTLLRKAEIRLTLPGVGYFSLGQGNMAGHGITGFDFSNTTVTATNSVGDTASGELAVFADGTTSSQGLETFFPTFEASRRFRVRYDSLARSGLSWAVSIGKEVLQDNNDNTYADAALRYETNWQRFRVKTGIGYAYNDGSPDFVSGSVAMIDDQTGVNLTLAAGANSAEGRYAYGKLGLIREFFEWGSTALSVDYYVSANPASLASGSDSWGIALVQDIDANQAQIYATYRTYHIEGSVRQYQDVEVIAYGIRFVW